MKHSLSFLFILFILSCNTNKKYEGKWTLDFFKAKAESPIQTVIYQDSIIFNHETLGATHKYPLKIEGNKFSFKNFKLKASINKDTLLINNTAFIKNTHDSIKSLYIGDYLLDITLPNLTLSFAENMHYKGPTNFIYFGKKINGNGYSLQLNDKYAKISDLIRFFSGHTPINEESLPFPVTVSFFDKNTKMSDVEKILFELKKSNQLKISFVNSIQLKSNDSLGLYYQYEALQKTIMPFIENDNYKSTLSNQPAPPPFPVLQFLIGKEHKTELFLLKKNAVYYKNKLINETDLKSLLLKVIKNNSVIISLFDLESDYDSFLNLNAIIDSVYREFRNDLALSRYSKAFDELKIEKQRKIIQELKLNHIWDYSIPNYNYLIKNEGSFLGLKLNPVE